MIATPSYLFALEAIANAFGRPFRLDFIVERTCRLSEWRHYDWGLEVWDQAELVSGDKCRNWNFFMGPFRIDASRTYKAA